MLCRWEIYFKIQIIYIAFVSLKLDHKWHDEHVIPKSINKL